MPVLTFVMTWIKLMRFAPFLVFSVVVFSNQSFGLVDSLAASIDRYLQPYVQGQNFSGDALVAKHGKIIFGKSMALLTKNVAFGTVLQRAST